MNRLNDVSIVFENEWLDEFLFEKFAVSPIDPQMGVLFASKKEDDFSVVKLFKMKQNEENKYSIDEEISTFHFLSDEQHREFIEYLPEMSAIDFIFLLGTSSMRLLN